MIEAKSIRKQYGELQVLKGVDLSVAKAEVVSIVGASGAGKTTLLQILGTLERPDSGTLEIGGQDVTKLGSNALSAFRNKHIGFVFQFHHLLPEFTALENVMMPGLIAGRSMAECTPRAEELLARLNVLPRKTHKPGQLSGGEQQRMAVARALFNNPSVVLADEPSGNLDSAHAKELHKLFFELRDELQQTFVIVTHNEELADMADRKLVMKDGVI
ncbi:MAG: ABC transporter ATP-binding protein [Flavobacteriales bacterium]